MPVVLATAEGAESSGYTYDDQTGVAYEYPDRYRKRIHTGDTFVYHVAKRGYIGTGVIGDIRPSATPGRWVCSVSAYRPFDLPVPLMAPDGYYYEARPADGKETVYWAMGVRSIGEDRFEQLVAAAAVNSAIVTQVVTRSGGYASKEVADAVEAISVIAALDWLRTTFPMSEIKEMPHNNPGFDIRVGPAASPDWYVEVKGTQAGLPTFWVSEGERQFSVDNPANYLLIVVTDVDLVDGAEPTIHVRYGSIDGPDFELTPSQWRGRLLAS